MNNKHLKTTHDNNIYKKMIRINIKRKILKGLENKSNIVNPYIKKNFKNIMSGNSNMSNFYQKHVKDLDNSPMFNNYLSNNKESSFLDQFAPLKFNKNQKITTKNNHNPRNWTSINNLDMTYGITNEENFTHNNMAPHFKSKGMIINDYNINNINNKMNLFTGSSRDFIPKKEILQEHFKKPERDNRYTNGAPNQVHRLQRYYLPSREKRNDKPFEEIKVGPGLNIPADQTTRPDEGLFDLYRPMPKNVRADQKQIQRLLYEPATIPSKVNYNQFQDNYLSVDLKSSRQIIIKI